MRTYFVETRLGQSWLKQAKKYYSCKKAHTAARRVTAMPARVCMVMEKMTFKDGKLAAV